MKFGDEIEMLRDYDGGRFRAGQTYTVGIGEPEDGKIMPGIAKTLCSDAADGEGPYAKRVESSDDQSTTDDEE